MARALPISSYSVLGLLSLAPMSGYDLVSAADKSIANFWPISKTQIYAELGRLEELGLVQSTAVAQEKLPDKRVFSLTPSGEAALDQWLEQEGNEPPLVRVPFLLRVFFGHRVSKKRLEAAIDELRAASAAERDSLKGIVDMLAGIPDASWARATALFGLRQAEAAVKWADEVGAMLPARPHAPDPRRLWAPTARRLFAQTPQRVAGRRKR